MWSLPLVFAVAAVGMGGRSAEAGYLSVSMTPPTQCGYSTVTWSGDDGPYHLLLTPTTFVEHGYNIWIQAIDASRNSYNLSINQPAQEQFVLTMWGASGIQYAATTDIMTVGTQTNPYVSQGGCFLSDAAILDLYTFSFNITNTYDDYPPQCQNLTMSWPTSLESNVTGDTSNSTRRSVAPISPSLDTPDRRAFNRMLERAHAREEEKRALAPEIVKYDASSSKDGGNTTSPPTMFGIIPLGNSFDIPITYSSKSRFASSLPASSIADPATTHTDHGTTYLNWTINVAKGTRFILVAGIGSQEQWASGGSSALLTVGQGTTGCMADSHPSITASETSASSSASAPPDSQGVGHGGTPTKTIIACVVSVVATLFAVGVLWLCCRVRRRRRLAAEAAFAYPPGKPDRDSRGSEAEDAANQLDLVASRNGGSTSGAGRYPAGLTPLNTSDYMDPFRDRDGSSTSSPGGSGRASTTLGSGMLLDAGGVRGFVPQHSDNYTSGSGTYASDGTVPLHLISGAGSGSPAMTNGGAGPMHREDSQDPLLGSGARDSPVSPVDSPAWRQTSRRGPLTLHDPTVLAGTADLAEDPEGDGEALTDLKRDTLAMAGSSRAQGSQSLPPGAAPPRNLLAQAQAQGRANPRARRRGEEDQEMQYVVHRDGGRVRPDQLPARSTPTVELPPRYEELDWDEIREGERRQEGGATI